LDGAETGSAADADGCGGVSTGSAASGVGGVPLIGDAVGVGAGDAASVALGSGKASFVPKTNSSIALPSCLRFSVLAPALPRFPHTVGTLFQNMRQVDLLASHTVADSKNRRSLVFVIPLL